MTKALLSFLLRFQFLDVDETVPLDGKVAEYVAVARKKDGIWYVGAISNWAAGTPFYRRRMGSQD